VPGPGKKGKDVWCTVRRGTILSMPIMLEQYWDREVAAAREVEALRTALAEHKQVRGWDETARLLHQMISDRRRFLSTASLHR
jgi:hypothetical protein